MKKQLLVAAFITQTLISHKGPINPSGVEFSGDQGPCAISEVIDPLNILEGQNCDVSAPIDPFTGEPISSADGSP